MTFNIVACSVNNLKHSQGTKWMMIHKLFVYRFDKAEPWHMDNSRSWRSISVSARWRKNFRCNFAFNSSNTTRYNRHKSSREGRREIIISLFALYFFCCFYILFIIYCFLVSFQSVPIFYYCTNVPTYHVHQSVTRNIMLFLLFLVTEFIVKKGTVLNMRIKISKQK